MTRVMLSSPSPYRLFKAFFPESKALLALSFLDLAVTTALLSAGLAVEANPILDFYVQKSILLFVFVKLLFCVGVLWVELARQYSPQTVRNLCAPCLWGRSRAQVLLATVTVAYCLIWIGGFYIANF